MVKVKNNQQKVFGEKSCYFLFSCYIVVSDITIIRRSIVTSREFTQLVNEIATIGRPQIPEKPKHLGTLQRIIRDSENTRGPEGTSKPQTGPSM